MKQLSLRLGGLLVFIFLCFVGCTDHEPRPVVLPRLTTLDINNYPLSSQLPPGVIMLGVSIEDLGNVPIVEYGVAWRVFATDTPQTLPTVNDSKTMFPGVASLGAHWQEKGSPLNGEIHYRGYVILNDGTVVYANNALNFD
jgi:hypothetical protein